MAPIIKNCAIICKAHCFARGRIPIIKNIIVKDEQGREYTATYLKRARGLVKKGRARWISESEICLACPPLIMEDKMEEYKNTNEIMPDEQIIAGEESFESVDENIFTAAGAETENSADGAEQNKPDMMNYILSQIEHITRDTGYIMEAMKALEYTGSEEPDDTAMEAKAHAISGVACTREMTNVHLIKFYEKMYDDARADKAKDDKRYYIDSLIDKLDDMDLTKTPILLKFIHKLIKENEDGQVNEDDQFEADQA